jgi:hypothetical protein
MGKFHLHLAGYILGQNWEEQEQSPKKLTEICSHLRKLIVGYFLLGLAPQASVHTILSFAAILYFMLSYVKVHFVD